MKFTNPLPNKYIIIAHFKSNWKWIAGMTASWLIAVVGILIYTVHINNASNLISIVIDDVPNSHNSISLALKRIIQSSPIFIAAVVSSSMIENTITQEISRGQITLWMTSSLSRNRIMYSKIMFVWLVNLLILAPSLVPIFVYSGIAVDANQYFGHMVLELVGMFVFSLMFTAIFALIASLFSHSSRLVLIIQFSIIGYMFLFEVLELWGPDWTQYLQYFDIRSLLVVVLVSGTKGVINLMETNLGWVLGALAINIALTSVFSYLACWIFKRKDLML
ncbi:hypothetical protein ELUMI_v1c00620 [Williamsoniiplasma luminosum]|uniref:Uncharacterized protein n=1 Tax=Williamsoniiplasma luminosum TaxID=214888 RepID=A0A2K8NSH2_9MOLU|nr:ABC transporter permease [Williamsoniiplasma luminosum]ATZ16790.1 hypothetical protein ELUMI_v1c00620 [Williamsoniiplasma luminosum]